MTAGSILRAVAVAIAIGGAIDPSIAWSRRDKPVVSMIAASTRDQALADRASRALERDFVVARGADAGAAALIVVGDRVPAGIEAGRTPAFALLPAEAVSIDRIDVAERASFDSHVPVGFIAHVPAGSSTVEARLRANGLVVDRQTYTLKTGDAALAGTLTFASTSTGLARLQIEVASGAAKASADAAIDVDRTRWSVLSFDPRPSWASTFVRRALEEDPRFVVTARVATAPRASTEIGAAPAALGESVRSFDLVLVGAPDALTASDVDRLETYARQGGAVCLVMDRLAKGPYERLTGSSGWTGRQTAQPEAIDTGSSRLGKLQVTELVLPALGPATETMATAAGRPVIWRTPVGSGAVIVSGALDAWRQRAAAGSDFARFWQTLIADAAAGARGPIGVTLGQRIFRPGAPMTIRVALGDPDTARATTTEVRARIEGAADTNPIRLWPEQPGLFTTMRSAPTTPGVYRVAVDGTIAAGARRASSVRGAANFLVAADAAEVNDRALVEAWSAAHGGIAVKNEDFNALRDALLRAAQPPARVATRYPLRSPWWIVPFALAISSEWWLRRRRGRP